MNIYIITATENFGLNNYKEGMLHGEREVYFDNGKLEKKERYEKGFNSRSFH